MRPQRRSDRPHLYLNGEFQDAPSTTLVHDSCDASELGVAGLADAAAMCRAVEAASTAQGAWSRLAAQERASILEDFARSLQMRARTISELVSRETGTPIATSAVSNGWAPAQLLRQYATVARQREWSYSKPSAVGHTVVRDEPVGVVAAIVPWNHPQFLAMAKAAPAMAAGCTVVVKPPPESALDGLQLADAAHEAGVPPGVFNVVASDAEASKALVDDPRVGQVSFTGATDTGRRIAEACGFHLRPATFELGGKSAAIVLPDANLDQFAADLINVCFPNNGQTCYACTRILAPEHRYDDVVEAVTATVATFQVGDPLDRATQIGPLVSAVHRRRVLGHIAQGAYRSRLVAGGAAPSDPGYFVEPTVFSEVDPDSRLAQEEIFGPVVSIIKYQDENHAVRIANNSAFGLAASVWSRDPEHAGEVAARLRVGTVGINGYQVDPEAPFGGRKGSGFGTELGPRALENYVVPQSAYITAPL